MLWLFQSFVGWDFCFSQSLERTNHLYFYFCVFILGMLYKLPNMNMIRPLDCYISAKPFNTNTLAGCRGCKMIHSYTGRVKKAWIIHVYSHSTNASFLMDFARSASLRSVPTVPVSSAPRGTAQPRWWALPESQTEPAARLLSALRRDDAVWSEVGLNLEDQEEAAEQRGSRRWALMWAERKLHAWSLHDCTNLLEMMQEMNLLFIYLWKRNAHVSESLTWMMAGWAAQVFLQEGSKALSVISTTADRKKHPN